MYINYIYLLTKCIILDIINVCSMHNEYLVELKNI